MAGNKVPVPLLPFFENRGIATIWNVEHENRGDIMYRLSKCMAGGFTKDDFAIYWDRDYTED
jgi:hypothetical protein